MGFWKRLFRKEKVEEEEPVQEEPIVDTSHPSYCNEICGMCKEIIAMGRYKKLKGYYFHKSCFKREKKRLFREGMVN